MSVGIIVAFISAAISIIAIIVSLRTAQQQQHLSRQLAEEEHALLFEQVRTQRDSDIICWTKDCVDLLSECESFVMSYSRIDLQGEIRDRYNVLRHRLSALIDQGRMFFPNQEPDGKGGHKPAAYRGFRQLILTVLVRIYERLADFAAIEGEADRHQLRDSLMALRRLFVSEAQLAINPRRFMALKDMNELKQKKGIEIQHLDHEES